MPTDPAKPDFPPPATAERWVIVLVPEAGPVPVGRRVAQVLKHAKRVHGLRCIEASATPLPEQLVAARREILELRQRLDQAEAHAARKPQRRAKSPAGA